MINLAVVFGGESCEHDISVITGLQLISKINKYIYNVIPIYIDKNGIWLTGKNIMDIDNYPDNLGKTTRVGLMGGNGTLYTIKNKKAKKFVDIDVAILCLHGVNGEDGTLASIMEHSKIPYCNSSILASSVSMDKVLFNDVCKGLNVDKVEYFSLFVEDYQMEKAGTVQKIVDFGLPVIIKPSRQGSSIGIEICKDKIDLAKKLDKAFEYDTRIVIEKLLDVKKEVNIACFLNKGEFIFSKTEEPIKNSDYLNFEDKYQSNSEGMQSMKRIMPARISIEQENKIKSIARILYINLDMFGVVRFDFLIDKNDNVYINEVNTIPGSMANYLFDGDYSYSELIELWISNALIRSDNRKSLNHIYNSKVLEQGISGFKK